MRFIEKFARVDNEDNISVDENNIDEEVSGYDLNDNFIDNFLTEQPVSDYYPPLKNVTKSKEEAMQESLMYKTDCDEYESDPENYFPKELEDIEIEYYEFENFDKRIDELKRIENKDFFQHWRTIFSAFYFFFRVKGIRLCVWRTKNLCTDEFFKQIEFHRELK